MLPILLLIFPLLTAQDDCPDGIFCDPPPKSMEEFLNEQQPPPPPKKALTVMNVIVKQDGLTLTLSDGEMFLVYPKHAPIAEGWFLGPAVEVTSSSEIPDYPYKITKTGSTSFVYAKKITGMEEPQQQPKP